MKNVDVLCVGATSYDIVFSIKEHPGADEKTVANKIVSCGGGPAANAAVTVARLGLKSAFCGYLGDDVFGNLHFEEFKNENVITDLVIRVEIPTPISSIYVKPNGERSVVNYSTFQKIITPGKIDLSIINPKIILFDGHQPDVSPYLLEYAQRRGIKTILDAGSVNKGTLELYNRVDYLVASQKFANEITCQTDPSKALCILSKKNNNVVITLGKSGLIWKANEDRGRLDAMEIQAIDTTGAGDVFHGAFAYCLVKGMEWDKMLKFSNIAAGLSCLKFGARTSIPSLKAILKHL